MNVVNLIRKNKRDEPLNPELVAIIAKGDTEPYVLADLERRFKVTKYYLRLRYGAKSCRAKERRAEAERWLGKIEQPPQPPVTEPAKLEPPPNRGLAWAAQAIGLGFGAVGFGVNCVFAFQLGDTIEQKLLYAALGGLIDAVSAFGLSWAFALPWFQGLLAGVIWALAAVYSVLVGLGFASAALDGHFARGMVADQYRASLESELARATTQLAKIRDPAAIDADIVAELKRLEPTRPWSTSKGCTEVTTSDLACVRLKQLRDERAGEANRAPLTAEIARLNAARFALQHQPSGDDAIGETVLTVTGIPPHRTRLYRNCVPALMLVFSGVLLAFPRALRRVV